MVVKKKRLVSQTIKLSSLWARPDGSSSSEVVGSAKISRLKIESDSIIQEYEP